LRVLLLAQALQRWTGKRQAPIARMLIIANMRTRRPTAPRPTCGSA